ncbi:MAG: PAS domain S-box protein [Acidobacteriota bacterium]
MKGTSLILFARAQPVLGGYILFILFTQLVENTDLIYGGIIGLLFPAGVALGMGIWLQDEEQEKAIAVADEGQEESLLRPDAVQSSFGIFQTDAQGNYLGVNAKWCQITGMSMRRALGMGWADGIHPEDQPRVLKAWQQAIEKAEDYVDEYRFITSPGQAMRLTVMARAVSDEGGEIISYIGTVMDSPKSKKTKQPLKELKKSFSKVINVLTQPISIGVDGRFLVVNDSLAELTGFSREELIGHTAVELGMVTNLDELSKLYEILKEHKTVKNFEMQVRRKDGNIRTYLVSGEILEFEGERFNLFIGNDITDRIKVEDELKQSQMAVKSLINDIDGIIWEAKLTSLPTCPDPAGKIHSPNLSITFVSKQAERLLGYPIEQWLSEADFWFNHIHPADQAWMVNYYTLSIDEFKKLPNLNLEYRMVAADGHIVWFRDKLNLFVADDQSILLRGMMIDISQQKAMERNLRASQKRFAKAFYSSPYWHSIISLKDYQYLDINNKALQSTGYTREELIGKNPDQLNLWVYEDVCNELAQLVEERKPINNIEIGFRRKTGEIREGLLSAEYLELDGEDCLLTTILDVTERNLNESLLEAINDIQSQFIDKDEPNKVFGRILEYFLSLTKSEYGFIGEILHTHEGTPYLRTHAITNIAWNEETRSLYESNAPNLEFYNLQTILGETITTDKPVIANDPRTGRLPAGHPPINKYLGLPIHFNKELVGMVGLANRPAGYHQEIIRFLQPLIAVCGSLIVSYKTEKEREHMELDLRASEERFSKAFNENLTAMSIHDAKNGQFIDVNEAALLLLGYAREEMLNRDPWELKIWANSEEAECVKEIIRSTGSIKGMEIDVKSKSGKQKTLLVSLQTILINDRKCLLTTSRDITDRNEREKIQNQMKDALRKSAWEWTTTFDAIEFPIVLTDRFGRIKRANQATLEASKITEFKNLVGATINDLATFEPWKTASKLLKVAIESGEAISWQAIEKSQGQVWDLTANPLLGHRPEENLIIITIREITPIIQLQESLRRNERMAAMGQLIAGVAHEVRNPLFGIAAAVETFEQVLNAKTEYQIYFDIISRNVKRLSSLMEELIDYGQPNKSPQAYGKIEEVIAQAINWCRQLQNERDVLIEYDFKIESPPILMDQNRLTQVFQNVLQNALQHSPAKSLINIEVNRIDLEGQSWIECNIIDQGCGFNPNDLPRVFEPFFTRRKGGIGLGLSLVQKIIEDYGGKIQVRNRLDGQPGAEVSISLPCLKR